MRRTVSLLLVLTVITGCTHWRRDDTVLLAPVPERKPVQIFTPTGTIVAHSVRVDSTTLSYIPRITPSECDSCRVTIPLASVDSVRTSRVSATRTVILVASLLLTYTLLVMYTPPTT